MMTLLDQIYSAREVEDSSGGRHKLHSEITPDEGALMTSLIKEHRVSRSLEIGCAYGLSSLHICGALEGTGEPRHTIIDPYQSTEWFGIGMNNLRRSGYDFVEFIEQPSEHALPDLIRAGRIYQFALIDGYHTFDQTLVDFYYVNRLLENGGVVVLDDVHLPAVRKVARFVAKLPNYRVVRGVRAFATAPSRKRRLLDSMLRAVARVIPARARDEAFADELFRSDWDLGIGYEMVAFRKTSDDVRGTHWFARF